MAGAEPPQLLRVPHAALPRDADGVEEWVVGLDEAELKEQCEMAELELESWDGKFETCIFADKRKHDTGVLRSRTAARQFATHPEEGLFAATPDEAVLNYNLLHPLRSGDG